MRVQVLGPVTVIRGNRPLALGGPRQRSVLAVMLVAANRVVPADQLIDEVWGSSPPAGGRDSLYAYVSNLRRVFGADRLERVANGYRLRVERSELDAAQFEEEAVEAHTLLGSAPHNAIKTLGRALGRWQGDAYQGIDLPMVSAESTRLAERRMAAVEDRLEARLAVGQHHEVTGELHSLRGEHPLRERLWGLSMLALYRDNRQAEALAAYQHLRTLLGEELGIEPSTELHRLEERILLHDPELELVVRTPHNLPEQLTSFVGRQLELIEAGQLLADSRLVTLAGVGGSGKTRLGLELARKVLVNHPDGAWLVDLASMNDPALVAGTVSGVLGVKEEPDRSTISRLRAFLAHRQILLILDNCEHLVEAVAELVRELLEGTDGLRILATSRELLGVPGEVRYEVGALSLPTPAEEGSAVRAGSFDAVRLFVERGQIVSPEFRLTDANSSEVVQICRQLDGMPLALELAATRLKTLSPRQIAAHLDDRFRLLTGGARTALPRQQTLRAAIDWSYDLLTEPERQVFGRLSVFAGAFTLEATERVCAGDGVDGRDIMDLLSQLVDKSLVTIVHDQSGEVRYRMLETIRHYAQERLAEAGDADIARLRHAEFYRDLVVGDAARIRDGQRSWMDRLEVEHDDLRQALDWSLEHGEIELGVDLGGGLFGFWLLRFHYREAKDWYSKLQPLVGDRVSLGRARVLEGVAAFSSEGEHSIVAWEEAVSMYRHLGEHTSLWRALQNLGQNLVELGKTARARAAIDEAVVIMRAAGNAHGCTLHLLGHLVYEEGDHQRARELFEEGVELGLRFPDAACQSANQLGMAALERREGNLAQARTLLDRALELARRLASQTEECTTIAELAMVDRDEGNLSGAGTLLRQSLDEARQVGDLLDGAWDGAWFVVWWARRLASLETIAGRHESAARLYGAVDTHARAAFEVWYDFERYAERRYLDLIRSTLDQNSFTQAWNEGKAMTVAELIDYAQGKGAGASVSELSQAD